MKTSLVFVTALAACTPAARRPASASSVSAGLDLAGMDSAIAPGDDFFAYANGAWIKSTEVPPDRSSWGTGGILAELTAKRTADLIAEAARTSAPAGSDARKIGDYYNTFMDESAIEVKGLTPLAPELAAIAAISDAQSLARQLGKTVRADVDVLNSTKLYTRAALGVWVAQDLGEPSD